MCESAGVRKVGMMHAVGRDRHTQAARWWSANSSSFAAMADVTSLGGWEGKRKNIDVCVCAHQVKGEPKNINFGGHGCRFMYIREWMDDVGSRANSDIK